MPKQILPDETSFDAFRNAIITEGFRSLSNTEFCSSFRRLGLQAPRKLKGREAGFIFSANNLTVYVWTTYLGVEGEARPRDSGWVLISEYDKAKYFAHPFMRTANFFNKLLAYAKACKERVVNRPLCPTCQRFMDITKGRGLKSRYWACKLSHNLEHITWDYGLSDESLNFLKAERKQRDKYRHERRAEGKTVGQAMLRRKPWGIKNPQNRT